MLKIERTYSYSNLHPLSVAKVSTLILLEHREREAGWNLPSFLTFLAKNVVEIRTNTFRRSGERKESGSRRGRRLG